MFKININGDVFGNTIYNNSKDVNNEDNILNELYSALLSLQSFKKKLNDEDDKNELLATFLRRNSNLFASDETRQGRSGSEKKDHYKSGELDIGIRNRESGNIISIIEAFELTSCGDKNKVISRHIEKLLHRYDTAGNQENFIVIYSIAKDFNKLWLKYNNYIEKYILHNNRRLQELTDSRFDKSDIKIGLNNYNRNGVDLKLYHLFVNMYCDTS